MRSLPIALLAAVLALPTLAACGTAPASVSGKVQVVAGENFWGDVVSQIGGSHVKVTSIISDPNTDPHQYESSDKNAIAIAAAGLVVENGAGYDDFLPKLVASSGGHPDVLEVAKVLGVTGTDPNPHLWYETAALPKVATAIADRLGTLDPAHKATYSANAAAFSASLKPIDDVIARMRQKYAGTPIAYTERLPGYLTDAAGLRLGVPVGFPQAVEAGTDPSPKDTLAFDDAIKTKAVKVLLYNAQVTDTQTNEIKALAATAGVPVVGVTETMPPSYHRFQDWQLAQAQALLTALGGA